MNKNYFLSFATSIQQRKKLIDHCQLTDPTYPNLTKWRARKTLVTDEEFTTMLQENHYTPEQFENYIAPLSEEKLETLFPEIQASSWYSLHKQLFTLSLPVTDDLDSALRFHLSYFIETMQAYAKKFAELQFTADFWEKSATELKKEWMTIAGKTLIWDVHDTTERMDIPDRSPKEQFQAYLDLRFGTKEATEDFFLEYPTLARLCSERLQFALDNFKLFIQALAESKTKMQKKFDLTEPFTLSDIVLGQGDSHSGGKTVLFFTIQNKDFVFKYKDLHIGEQFNEFLRFIESLHPDYHFYQIKRIVHSNYTIEERIYQDNCETEEDVQLFYQRYGHLLAIAYWLGSSDLHMENLIAYGAYPVLIDVETILKVKPPATLRKTETKQQIMKHSILNSGLLPSKKYWQDNPDISALHGGKEKTQQKIRKIKEQRTVNVALELKEEDMEKAQNLPLLEGKEISFKNYTHLIEQSFISFNHFLLQYQTQISNKIEELFRNVTLRFLLRDTQDYGNFLSFATHPSSMINYIEREKLMENLWHTTLPQKNVILAEIKEMLVHDVPLFTVNTSKRDLLNEHNTFKNYFPISPLENVLQHIQEISIETLQMVTTELRESLGTLTYETAQVNIPKNNTTIQDPFLQRALDLADYLCQTLWFNTDTEKIYYSDLEVKDNSELAIHYPAENLYNGLAGIYIFLQTAHRYPSKSIYQEWLKKIEAELFQQNTLRETTEKISAFYGIGACLTAAFWSYLLTKENDDKIKVQMYITLLLKQVDTVSLPEIEWLEGSASLLALLTFIQQQLPQKEILVILKKLINQITPEEMEFTGFAHGYIGIIYGLTRAKMYLPDINLEEKTQQLTTYFEKERPKSFNQSWCHGQLGINSVLEGNKQSPYLPLDMVRDACLCHGLAGDLTYIIDDYLSNQVTHKFLVDSARPLVEEPFSLKQDTSFVPLGLFSGISGIGYQLLRVYQPDTIPDILFFK